MDRSLPKNILLRFRSFCLTPFAFFIPLAAAITASLIGGDAVIPCLFVEAMWIALLVFLHNDIIVTLFPFLCLMITGMTLLSDLTTLMAYIPYAAIPVAGLIFHVIYYRRPTLKLGVTFYGLIATSLALLLGGLGTISPADYFNPVSLFHTAGSAACVLLVYLFCVSDYKERKAYDSINFFLRALFFVGILCCFCIFDVIFKHGLTSEGLDYANYRWYFPYRNAMANLLIMTLPAPFYFLCRATKWIHKLAFFIVGGIFYVSLLLTTARTALLFGSLLFLILIAYFFVYEKNRVFKLIFGIFAALCGAVFIWLAIPLGLFNVRFDGGGDFLRDNEARMQLLRVSIDDFLMNPIFGIGLGNTRHADIYSAPGMVSYYHLYFPQLWGSMGIVGLLAYGYQFMLRLRLAFLKPTAQTVALSLSYLGTFFYSMTDPGEFTTIPFGILSVLIFILLEKHAEEVEKPLPFHSLSKRGRARRLLFGE